jgi:hypothetical protein
MDPLSSDDDVAAAVAILARRCDLRYSISFREKIVVAITA